MLSQTVFFMQIINYPSTKYNLYIMPIFVVFDVHFRHIHSIHQLPINKILSLLLLLRQHQVRDDRDQKYRRHTVIGKDILHDIREDGENFRHLRKADSYAERKGGDRDIALAEAAVADHLKAADHNISKHNDRTAAEDSFRKRVEQCAKYREQSGKDHDSRSGRDRKTVDNFCHCDQSDILAE